MPTGVNTLPIPFHAACVTTINNTLNNHRRHNHGDNQHCEGIALVKKLSPYTESQNAYQSSMGQSRKDDHSLEISWRFEFDRYSCCSEYIVSDDTKYAAHGESDY